MTMTFFLARLDEMKYATAITERPEQRTRGVDKKEIRKI